MAAASFTDWRGSASASRSASRACSARAAAVIAKASKRRVRVSCRGNRTPNHGTGCINRWRSVLRTEEHVVRLKGVQVPTYGAVEDYEDNQLVVALPHLDLVGKALSDLDIVITDTEDSPPLGLALLTLNKDSLEKAAGSLRGDRKLM